MASDKGRKKLTGAPEVTSLSLPPHWWGELPWGCAYLQVPAGQGGHGHTQEP